MGRREIHNTPPGRRVTFTDALRNPTFLLLYAAELQSIAGDQFARVALAVLVYRQSGSAAATGLVFAATYLPAIVGSAALGPLADRFSRRAVMVVVELLRAALVATMAMPGVSTSAVMTLLVISVFIGPLFTAAEVSFLAAALPGDVFRVANGLRMLGSQGAQVLGFALGGVVVAALGARPALAIDALTFVVSAGAVALSTRRGPVGAAPEPPAPGTERTARAVLWRHRRVRSLVGLSALAGFFIAPEGVAVPFAAEVHGGTAQGGLLLAALPLGSVVGVYVLIRRVAPEARTRVASGMAIGCGLPLVVSGLAPTLPIAAICWFLSGALAAYQVEVLTQIVQAVPDQIRARAMGICNAILLGAQGLGVAAFGGIADATTAAHSVALAGALGTVAAAGLVWAAQTDRPTSAMRADGLLAESEGRSVR